VEPFEDAGGHAEGTANGLYYATSTRANCGGWAKQLLRRVSVAGNRLKPTTAFLHDVDDNSCSRDGPADFVNAVGSGYPCGPNGLLPLEHEADGWSADMTSDNR
jgi:hypothetical protein